MVSKGEGGLGVKPVASEWAYSQDGFTLIPGDNKTLIRRILSNRLASGRAESS